jgi:hypothetical protein
LYAKLERKFRDNEIFFFLKFRIFPSLESFPVASGPPPPFPIPYFANRYRQVPLACRVLTDLKHGRVCVNGNCCKSGFLAYRNNPLVWTWRIRPTARRRLANGSPTRMRPVGGSPTPTRTWAFGGRNQTAASSLDHTRRFSTWTFQVKEVPL